MDIINIGERLIAWLIVATVDASFLFGIGGVRISPAQMNVDTALRMLHAVPSVWSFRRWVRALEIRLGRESETLIAGVITALDTNSNTLVREAATRWLRPFVRCSGVEDALVRLLSRTDRTERTTVTAIEALGEVISQGTTLSAVAGILYSSSLRELHAALQILIPFMKEQEVWSPLIRRLGFVSGEWKKILEWWWLEVVGQKMKYDSYYGWLKPEELPLDEGHRRRPKAERKADKAFKSGRVVVTTCDEICLALVPVLSDQRILHALLTAAARLPIGREIIVELGKYASDPLVRGFLIDRLYLYPKRDTTRDLVQALVLGDAVEDGIRELLTAVVDRSIYTQDKSGERGSPVSHWIETRCYAINAAAMHCGYFRRSSRSQQLPSWSACSTSCTAMKKSQKVFGAPFRERFVGDVGLEDCFARDFIPRC